MVYTNSQGSCVDHLVRRFRITLINRPKAVALGGIFLLGMLLFTASSSTTTSIPSTPAPQSRVDIGNVASVGKPKSNFIYNDGKFGSKGLQKKDRYQAIGMKGVTLWFTGFSGSGKSTVGKKLEEVLVRDYGKHTYRLDGDNLRFGINSDLGFAPKDRTENVRRVGEVAKLFAESGVIVVASLISPYRADRDRVRKIHEDAQLEFMEVFVDVPIEAAEARDPKGLYKKARSGAIKGFTGLDAPYEAPRNPEIRLKSHEMSIDEEVRVIIKTLQARGILTATENTPEWYPALLPPDGGMDWEAPSYSSYSAAAAAKFPQVLLNDIDLQWVQCIGEGWAAPLKGFMREGVLLQTLHFNSMLTDPFDLTGNKHFSERQTNYDDYSTKLQMGTRENMPVPIVLPITAATKKLIASSRQLTLVSPTGKPVAVLTDPEIYDYRKEEVISRLFGGMDPDHPYIKVMMASGPYLVGGEIELLERIRYNDGLDSYRLTPKELRERFVASGTDAVYAFQTRNPTHAGHAYLMQDAGRQLKALGYKRPLLWLTPLGGWTKDDDMPLDVRIHQHQVVIEEGMLPSDTVMAIWPSPMIYAGPTEVQWHCKSRRNVGARFFITGRDPAGIKRSKNANQMQVGGDFYDGNHGRYVLQTSPGLGEMKILSFSKVVYDKLDNKMKPPDKSRKSDFLSISGSTMRALAKKGAPPCPDDIPSNWEETKPCIPNGFMVKRGWDLMIQYYQDPSNPNWIGYSRMMSEPLLASGNFVTKGTFGKPSWTLYFQNADGDTISPWHDLPLYPPPLPLFDYID